MNKPQLSPRELEVVSAVVGGYSHAEITQNLGLTVDTVKHPLFDTFVNSGVPSRLELALLARQWLDSPE